MGAHKGVAFAEVVRFSVYTKGLIGEFAAKGSVGEQIADPAFNVHPAIGFGSTGLVTDGVKTVESGAQMDGQGFQHIPALVKGHSAKGRIAYGSRIVNGARHVDAPSAGICDGGSGYSVEQGLSLSFSGDPFSLDVILQLFHDGICSKLSPSFGLISPCLFIHNSRVCVLHIQSFWFLVFRCYL